MARYAYFNSNTPSPSPVLGWYDTEASNYDSLPGAANLFTLTDAQWDARLAAPNGWAVSNGALIPYNAPDPPVPLDIQAANALTAHIAMGIAITCSGNSALNATYALDDTTLTQIGSVARDAKSGMGLPGGASTFTYPDAAGVPRTFTSAQLIMTYIAMRDLLLQLNTQAAVIRQGGSPVWPNQAAVIT